MRSSGNKNLDFELNLLPVISVLAVCIGFLLLTTVWNRVGTFDLSQALGTAAGGANEAKKPVLWITLSNDGSAQVVVKDAPQLADRLQLSKVGGKGSHVGLENVMALVTKIKQQVPALNTALVIPAPESSYEDMIAVMDQLKKNKIADIGIAPL